MLFGLNFEADGAIAIVVVDALCYLLYTTYSSGIGVSAAADAPEAATVRTSLP